MRALAEAAALVGAAVLAAGVMWLVTGGPDRTVPCDPATLEDGYVCLETVMTAPEGVLWVDARPRALWERNGMAGSILLTDDAAEDWDSLLAEAGERLVTAERVVVYCGQEGCGSSKAVAAKIRESGLAPEVKVLFGGWKALFGAGVVAARSATDPTDSK